MGRWREKLGKAPGSGLIKSELSVDSLKIRRDLQGTAASCDVVECSLTALQGFRKHCCQQACK